MGNKQPYDLAAPDVWNAFDTVSHESLALRRLGTEKKTILDDYDGCSTVVHSGAETTG